MAKSGLVEFGSEQGQAARNWENQRKSGLTWLAEVLSFNWSSVPWNYVDASLFIFLVRC
jgi:hypothetical protein